MKLKKYPKGQLLDLYRMMLRIRRFEEQVLEFYKSGSMSGLAHLYMGEEAVATGACAALKDEDKIASTHRGHGHVLARGADINRMMAEILGKKTGYNKGRGGSMHIMDTSKGILGANGIVGAGIPIATGAAFAAKYKKSKGVAVSFMGDGATNEGTFHESVNMAAIWNLPCIYVIENNLYGMYTCIDDICNTPDVAVRAQAYNIPGVVVDGMDVIAVYEAVTEAANRAREGKGPTVIECKTYRWYGHHAGDPALYRKPDEKEEWMAKCPVKTLRAELLKAEIAEENEIKKLENEVEEEIKAAVKYAQDSEYPDAADAFNNVYAD